MSIDPDGKVYVWSPYGNRELDETFSIDRVSEVEALNESARDEGGHVQWFVDGKEFCGSVYEPGLTEKHR